MTIPEYTSQTDSMAPQSLLAYLFYIPDSYNDYNYLTAMYENTIPHRLSQ